MNQRWAPPLELLPEFITTIARDGTILYLNHGVTFTADEVIGHSIDVKNGGDTEERLRATGRPGRLHAVLQTRTGESSKEYLISSSAVILDEDVFHQHFFIPLARRSGDVSVIIPRRNSQVSGRIEDRGTEKIKVDGTEVSALHLVITLPDGARDLWFDDTGRLLKVAVPARGLVALREELPR